MKYYLQGCLVGVIIFLIGEAWISKTIRDDHTEAIATLVEICKNQNDTNTIQNSNIDKIIEIVTK